MTVTTTNPVREARINQRLAHIHHRIEQICAIEGRAARFGGFGKNGEFDPERQRLIDETDLLLDALVAISGSLKFRQS